MTIEKIISRIIEFQNKQHPSWDESNPFDIRISNLPLYFMEFNHSTRDIKTQSITITHYVPCKAEMIALSKIIKLYNDKFIVCDIGCGNGLLGSLLAREKVNVYGIDNRSYKQPQIYSFYDKQCYEIREANISDKDVLFDVAFCSWMTPGLNLTPMIAEKDPKIIIHLMSRDRQTDGSQTTGTVDAYLPPPGYIFLTGWESLTPKDFFMPIRIMTGVDLDVNTQKRRAVIIHVRKDLGNIDMELQFNVNEYYDWDIEREFINNERQKMGLTKSYIKNILSGSSLSP